MQVKKSFPASVLFFLGFCILVTIGACSNNNAVNSSDKASKTQNKVAVNTEKTDGEKWKHSHPSNPCTAAIAHSHLYKVKVHEHRYDCESTNEFVSNAHIHPPLANGRKFRHVHPNGSNKHKHHK